MAETPTYGYTDIQRYLQQEMSSQEMHEFEKALMNDPFLADTLEGFSAAKPRLAEQHIKDIEKAITGDQKKARVVPLATQQTAWWKVAAIIFIIVSAGAITYAVLNNNSGFIRNSKEIAATKPNQGKIENETVKSADGRVAKANISSRDHSSNRQSFRSGTIRHNNTDTLISKVEAANNYEGKKETAESLSISSVYAIVPKANDLQFSRQLKLRSSTIENEFRGKLTDKPHEPVGDAIIKANNNKIITTDSGGNFLLKARDSASKSTKIKSNASDNKTTLKENELSLSEIVVTEMRNRNKNPGPNISVDSSNSAEPVGGLKNYQQYLGRQQDFMKGLESLRNVYGELVIEFSTNKNGQPIKVQVPREMDKIMAEKTIEIITKGPLWKNNQKDKKVKVIIEF